MKIIYLIYVLAPAELSLFLKILVERNFYITSVSAIGLHFQCPSLIGFLWEALGKNPPKYAYRHTKCIFTIIAAYWMALQIQYSYNIFKGTYEWVGIFGFLYPSVRHKVPYTIDATISILDSIRGDIRNLKSTPRYQLCREFPRLP